MVACSASPITHQGLPRSSNRLAIQRPAPQCKSIAALGLIELGAHHLVGLRHIVHLLSLLDGSPAQVLRGNTQRIGCAVARPAVTYLRHVVEPFIWMRHVVVLTELDLERL